MAFRQPLFCHAQSLERPTENLPSAPGVEFLPAAIFRRSSIAYLALARSNRGWRARIFEFSRSASRAFARRVAPLNRQAFRAHLISRSTNPTPPALARRLEKVS